MRNFFKAFSKYAVFRGVAGKKEFMDFYLVNYIIGTLLFVGVAALGGSQFLIAAAKHAFDAVVVGKLSVWSLLERAQWTGFSYTVGLSFWIAVGVYFGYMLISRLPYCAVMVRRYHAVGKSGWSFLICLVPWVGKPIILSALGKQDSAEALRSLD